MTNLSHVRGVIWDLDGTLYRYNDYFIEACNIAAAQTIIELGLDLTYDAALAIARNSQILHGHSFKSFGEMGVRYEDYHHSFHEKIDHLVVMKNQDLKSNLSKLSMPMTVLTNASRDWALRTLTHLGMMDVFAHTDIFALEDVGFKAKAYHTDGFDIALKHMGVAASDSIVIEDLSRNLIVPKKMGMITALVHHNTKSHDENDHVDFVFDDTLDVIKAMQV